jgi:hypothetical protein
MMLRAATAIAIMPEAHWRSTVMPPTVTGRPARSAASRAMFGACEPCGRAQPMMTSSTSAGSSRARSTACRMACPASVGESVLLKAPR